MTSGFLPICVLRVPPPLLHRKPGSMEFRCNAVQSMACDRLADLEAVLFHELRSKLTAGVWIAKSRHDRLAMRDIDSMCTPVSRVPQARSATSPRTSNDSSAVLPCDRYDVSA
jgi:hypothetical protein